MLRVFFVNEVFRNLVQSNLFTFVINEPITEHFNYFGY